MNVIDSFDESGDDALERAGSGIVQTSAQNADEVVHKEPALGGSYIRIVDTGDLVKQELPAEPKEGE